MRMKQKKMRFLTASAMMAAVLCVLSPITIPMGIVPCTLSVLALFLVATLSPVRVSLTATAVYLALGAVGLPVFSSFSGGFSAFVSPSGGFLWGYLPAVLAVSFICQKSGGRLFYALLGMLLGLVILYATGLFGICVLTEATLGEALAVGVLPFLLPDAFKISVALALYTLLYSKLSKTILVNKQGPFWH